MADRLPCPSEAAEQSAVFVRCALLSRKYPELLLLFAIPNGGSRHPAEAANLKRQGVKAGVPDMFLPVSRGTSHGLFIELKRRKGGRVSDEQRRWLNELERQGFAARVCKGADEAMKTMIEYLEG